MNPRSHDERNNPFFVFSKKKNDKPAHWVGYSKLGSLDIDDFFKRTPKFDENQAIVTVNTEE